jgi:hypothetical protein
VPVTAQSSYDDRMPAASPDLASIVAAARKVPRTELDWWSSAYLERSDRTPFADTLTAITSAPPRSLDKLIDGKVPPWHLALLARAAKITKKTTATLSGKALFVAGSLHIKGPLQLKGPLVVTGDLVVDGPVIDMIEKWLLLVVGGDLTAHAVASAQALLVGGDCKVRDVVWGNEMHCPLIVRGRLSAPLVVLTDHRPMKIGNERGVAAKLVNPTQTELEAVVDPKLIGDCEIKRRAMLKRLLEGCSVSPPNAQP